MGFFGKLFKRTTDTVTTPATTPATAMPDATPVAEAVPVVDAERAPPAIDEMENKTDEKDTTAPIIAPVDADPVAEKPAVEAAVEASTDTPMRVAEPEAVSQLFVLLNENFKYSYAATEDGQSARLIDGVLENERQNPHNFLPRIITPIVDSMTSRPEKQKLFFTGSSSWADALARIDSRDVVDCGSSKCLRLCQTAGAIQKSGMAPSLTVPLPPAKAGDFGIAPPEGGWPKDADLTEQQYSILIPFLIKCAKENVRLVATEGVRTFARDAGLALEGLTVHALLNHASNPCHRWYAADLASRRPASSGAASDGSDAGGGASAVEGGGGAPSAGDGSGTGNGSGARTSDDNLAATLAGLFVEVLSGEEEAKLEFSDARHKYGLPESLPPSASLVFLSMGGMSTQAVVLTPHSPEADADAGASTAGVPHVASFEVGKTRFRQGVVEMDAAAAAKDALIAFVNKKLG